MANPDGVSDTTSDGAGADSDGHGKDGRSDDHQDKLDTYRAWRDDPERISAIEAATAPGRLYGRR